MKELVVITLAFLSLSGFMEKRIDGSTAEDVFKAPGLAALASAACAGDVAGVQTALRAGADPNGLSVDGGTPLLWATKCQNAKGVKALLEAGANANYAALGRYTPLLSAATSKDPAVLKALVDHGANPNVAEGEWTPFRYALAWGVKTGDWRNYYTLLNGGANIEYARSSGYTVALDAVGMWQFDKVAELLSRGYNRDLEWLGRAVQVSQNDPGGGQLAWRDKVIKMLEEKGVHFPIPPLHRLPR